MSTRACIARIQGDGFLGVYHHWDGYPTGLGKTLWQLVRDNGRTTTLKVLIDRHPAGWSTINGKDWTKVPGFVELGTPHEDAADRPECYCHGDRHEEPNPVTQADDMGMEWAYIFDEPQDTLTVLERTRPDGRPAVGMFGTLGADPETGERDDRWTPRGTFPLSGVEPNWTELEGSD